MKYIVMITVVLFAAVYLFTLPGTLRHFHADSNSGTSADSESDLDSSSRQDSEAGLGPDSAALNSEADEMRRNADNPWALFLVNKENPLPDNYAPQTTAVDGSYLMDSRMADCMKQMIADAKKDGITIKVVSAYRTIDYQKGLLDQEIGKWQNKGQSEEEAYQTAVQWVQIPGRSEHNSGLAADLNSLEESFDATAEFRWLQEHAEDYGFILRYPKGKESVTGINYEPWHYRFVGIYHAKRMNRLGLTLEEYAELPEVKPCLAVPQ